MKQKQLQKNELIHIDWFFVTSVTTEGFLKLSKKQIFGFYLIKVCTLF